MQNKRTAVTVVGSANTDLTTTVPHFPAPGETLLGEELTYNPGGKGNNQATASQLAGAETHFVAGIGRDALSQVLLEHFWRTGLDQSQIRQMSNLPTGCALIEVQKKDGQNRIVVIPGANHALTPEAVREAELVIKESRIMLVQLEIPQESVYEALLMGKENGLINILNPAPATPLPECFFPLIDLFTPNEIEAGSYAGMKIETDEEIREAARKLLEMGIGQVVITLGEKGCFYTNGKESFYQSAFPVEAVDTTGAGDAFNGALAAGLARGEQIEDAIRFATAFSALSVTKHGAAGSMPTYEETVSFLEERTDGKE